MMKEPTNRAMRANTIRKVLKKAMSSFRSCWSSAVISSPVSTSVRSGTTSSMRSARVAWSTPSSATTLMASTRPGSVRAAWASSGLNITSDAPPGLSSPAKVTTPTTRLGPRSLTGSAR